jgi:predicted component of viral defense system (DUF524 family)
MPLIALHRVHFDIGAGVQIEIESAIGRPGELAPSLSVPGLVSADVEVDPEQLSSGRMPPMCWRDTGELFECFQLREDTDYFIDVTIPLPLAEAIHRATAHAAWPFSQRLVSAFTREPVKRWREIQVDSSRHTVVTGQLRLRSHAGVLELGTELGGALKVEVVCRKLRYFEEFKALLDGLAEKAAELLLAYDTPVSLSFGVSQEQASNDAALHFLMRYVMSPTQLPAAAQHVLNMPHARLVEQLEVRPIEDLDEADPDLIYDELDVSTLSQGGPLARFFGGFTPRELPQRDVIESYDTPENRYTKALLEHCQLLAQRLEGRMVARKRKASEREAKAWTLYLDELLQHNLWKDVGPLGQIPANSQTMLHQRGYKELFRIDVSLRMSLGLTWSHGTELADGLVGDIRPVSQIYEYWCFFVLREVLQSLCLLKAGGNFVTVNADGLRVQLKKGRRSECRFTFTSASGVCLDVSLFYNRRFLRPRVARPEWNGSYTAAFTPDYSVVIRGPGGSTHWLHFDAKYRLEHQHTDLMFSCDDSEEDTINEGVTDYENELTRVHKHDDLYKMHTYRDGILSTRGAYVLYPGDGLGGKVTGSRPNFFVRHPSAFGGSPSEFIPSVGAFPLTPEETGEQTDAIRQFLKKALEVISTGGHYIEEQASFGAPP